MNDHYWRAISVDSVEPGVFPPVPLFMRTSGNYVLYKDAERNYTGSDRERLNRTNTEFLYVRTGDMEEIRRYLEGNLKELLDRPDLDSAAKGRILYQTLINYVIDSFEAPEQAANLERCRDLVRHLIRFVTTDPHALSSVHAVVANNLYIFAHSVQVTALNLLAHHKLFNTNPDELIDVGVGSLLHDYGMIFISNEILQKPDALSEVEYYKVKRHTQKGYEFLKETGVFGEAALTIVRHHHERYDGDGYPAGLKGDDIPRSAQLSSLCDVYSALTLDRSYRKAKPHDEAVALLRTEMQGAFNPKLLSAFLELLSTIKPA